MGAFRFFQAQEAGDLAALREIRELVFVVEQGIPLNLEWDEWDTRCVHCLALTQDGQPIGTGRLLPDGHLGRLAVLPAWRGAGVGRAVLAWLLNRARSAGFSEVRLNAQTHAVAFYERQGFVVEGAVFMDAGIAHIPMRRSLIG